MTAAALSRDAARVPAHGAVRTPAHDAAHPTSRNAEHAPSRDPVHDAQQHRRRRAAVAALLLDRAPVAAATLDWAALDAAPAWLALPPAALDALASRVGAVLCAPALRLWIDTARLAAARAVLGDAWLRALLARPDLPGAPAAPRIATAAQVPGSLQAWGAAVLLATLPAALRGACAAALPHPAPLAIDAAAAHALVAHAMSLPAGMSPSPEALQ